jgi:hypothetical protein
MIRCERLRGCEAVIARLEGALADADNEIVLTSVVEERMRGLVSRVQANEHRQEIRVAASDKRSPLRLETQKARLQVVRRAVSFPEAL